MSCGVTEGKTGRVLASPYKVKDFKLRRLPPRSGATVTEDSHDFSWGEMTNPGRVLCLQALYFPILQHRGAHTHPMSIHLYRGSTPQKPSCLARGTFRCLGNIGVTLASSGSRPEDRLHGSFCFGK